MLFWVDVSGVGRARRAEKAGHRGERRRGWSKLIPPQFQISAPRHVPDIRAISKILPYLCYRDCGHRDPSSSPNRQTCPPHWSPSCHLPQASWQPKLPSSIIPGTRCRLFAVPCPSAPLREASVGPEDLSKIRPPPLAHPSERQHAPDSTPTPKPTPCRSSRNAQPLAPEVGSQSHGSSPSSHQYQDANIVHDPQPTSSPVAPRALELKKST